MSEQTAAPELTGVIKNARFLNVGGDRHVIYGNIYHDAHGRFPDGEHIKTSVVVDQTDDIVTTRSGSIYKLELRH